MSYINEKYAGIFKEMIEKNEVAREVLETVFEFLESEEKEIDYAETLLTVTEETFKKAMFENFVFIFNDPVGISYDIISAKNFNEAYKIAQNYIEDKGYDKRFLIWRDTALENVKNACNCGAKNVELRGEIL